jgi:ATP-dependent RNA helicase DeaD
MSLPPMNPALSGALSERGYLELTPVQTAVLQPEAAGRDLLVSAQTGSGKTVAYGLAFAATVLGDATEFGRAGAPLVLVVAPTRELAMQVHGELSWLYLPARGQVVACVGGMDPRRERMALSAGCHIVVGTPGRLRDHLERGQLDISALQVVVLDEADEMLDLGFREDLQFILDATPETRRTLLFSATIAREIASLARDYQRDAVRIDTVARNKPHADIEYRCFRAAPNEIEHAVVNVLRYFEARGSLVFCATRDAVRHLHARLVERGFSAVTLSGELSQNERTNALQSLRDGRARVCIATDVAARGLDLPDLDLVVHAELPTNKEILLHRSGRTGRAGRKGICALVVPFTRRRRAEQLLEAAGVRATWSDPPSADEIRVRDQERLLADPLLAEKPAEEEVTLARALLAGRSAEDIAAALIRLYRSRLPAPEELFAGNKPEPEAARSGKRQYDARHEGDRAEGPRSFDRRVASPDGVWFRATVGRRNNADPKWLVPLICRLGHVTKKDIGVIRIFDHETKFEITQEASGRFAASVAGAEDGEITIEPASADPEVRRKEAPPKRPFKRAGSSRRARSG